MKPSRGLIVLACLALASGITSRATTQEGGARQAQLELSVKAPLASRSLPLDGVSVDGLVVAVGERGHILVDVTGTGEGTFTEYSPRNGNVDATACGTMAICPGPTRTPPPISRNRPRRIDPRWDQPKMGLSHRC